MRPSPLQRWLVAFILLTVLLFAAFLWVHPLLSIGGGYAAKHACSCHFLQDRELAEISEHDLNFSVLGLFDLAKDRDTITSSFFGLVSRRAVLIGGGVCVLVNDEERPLPELPARNPGTVGRPKTLQTVGYDLPPRWDATKLQAAIDYGMEPVPGGGARGLVLLWKGRLLAEAYAEGFTRNTPLLGWSMTKTLTGLLTGHLVLVSRIPQAPPGVRLPSDLFPTQWTDRRADITLADLLHMNSGLAWNEGYGSLTDATVMLHERPDFADFALRSQAIDEPGTVWNYSSGTTNILMEYLSRGVGGHRELYAVIDSFFAPIAPSLLIEPDQSGRPVGSSYGWATAQDWANLGQFMLQDGVWKGDTLLPPGWIDFLREPAAGSDGDYGGHLWLPGGDTPSLPADAFMMRGFQDQRVFVIPSLDLVVARLGHGEDKVTDFDGLVHRIIKAYE